MCAAGSADRSQEIEIVFSKGEKAPQPGRVGVKNAWFFLSQREEAKAF